MAPVRASAVREVSTGVLWANARVRELVRPTIPSFDDGVSYGAWLSGATPTGIPDGARSCLMASKRYRSNEHRMFHRDAGYLEGRRVRESRQMRAMANRTAFGRNLLAEQWSTAEFAALSRLFRTVTVARQSKLAVVDLRHCNARDTSGCGRTPLTATVGRGPVGVAVDRATHTLFSSDWGRAAVSILRDCDALRPIGCNRRRQVGIGSFPGDITVADGTAVVLSGWNFEVAFVGT